MSTYIEPARPKPYGPIYVREVTPPPPDPTPEPTPEPAMPTVNPPDEEILAFRDRVIARAEDIFDAPMDASPNAKRPNLADDTAALVDLGVKYMTFRTQPGIRDHEIATRKVEALMHDWRREGWLNNGQPADPGPLPEYPPLPPA